MLTESERLPPSWPPRDHTTLRAMLCTGSTYVRACAYTRAEDSLDEVVIESHLATVVPLASAAVARGATAPTQHVADLCAVLLRASRQPRLHGALMDTGVPAAVVTLMKQCPAVASIATAGARFMRDLATSQERIGADAGPGEVDPYAPARLTSSSSRLTRKLSRRGKRQGGGSGGAARRAPGQGPAEVGDGAGPGVGAVKPTHVKPLARLVHVRYATWCLAAVLKTHHDEPCARHAAMQALDAIASNGEVAAVSACALAAARVHDTAACSCPCLYGVRLGASQPHT